MQLHAGKQILHFISVEKVFCFVLSVYLTTYAACWIDNNQISTFFYIWQHCPGVQVFWKHIFDLYSFTYSTTCSSIKLASPSLSLTLA